MSKNSVKTQIDTDITNKTTSKSISPLNVGSNMKAVVDLIPDTTYKIYRATINQTGTNAPIATVFENTLGGTVVWTRQSVGVYRATLAGAFTIDKIFTPNIFKCRHSGLYTRNWLVNTGANVNHFEIWQTDETEAPVDGTTDSIEIIVYN